MTCERTPTKERELYVQRVTGLVDYVPLVDKSKAPDCTRSLTFTNALPNVLNVGARPVNATVVFDLDIDAAGRTDPDQQVKAFLQEFGIDLTDTLTVLTPSGGKHCYTLWPQGIEIPGNWKLHKLDDPTRGLFFKGDIRGSKSVGYVVTPGSVLDSGEYRIVVDAPVKELSVEGASKFMKYRDERTCVPVASTGSKTVTGSTVVKPGLVSVLPDGVAYEVSERRLARVKESLDSKQFSLWHEKRNFVFHALSCCVPLDDLVHVWESLEICGDTASGTDYGSSVLLKDAERLVLKFGRSEDHTYYCPLRGGKIEQGHCQERFEAGVFTRSLEENVEANVKKLKVSTSMRYVRALDMNVVITALNHGQRGPGSSYPLAFAIVEDFLQFWLNHGVTNILLGNEFLAGFYGVTVPEVARAKKLLLRKGIIEVTGKQAKGRTSRFMVSSQMSSVGLTDLLLAIRKREGQDVYLDERNGVFITKDRRVVEVLHDAGRLSSENFDRMPARLVEKNLLDVCYPVFDEVRVESVLEGALNGHEESCEDFTDELLLETGLPESPFESKHELNTQGSSKSFVPCVRVGKSSAAAELSVGSSSKTVGSLCDSKVGKVSRLASSEVIRESLGVRVIGGVLSGVTLEDYDLAFYENYRVYSEYELALDPEYLTDRPFTTPDPLESFYGVESTGGVESEVKPRGKSKRLRQDWRFMKLPMTSRVVRERRKRVKPRGMGSFVGRKGL